jgi:hypothetical protein
MQQIHNEADIEQAIVLLEKKQQEEEAILRQQVVLIGESLMPITIIKNTIKEAAAAHDLKNDFFKAIVGITAGYLTKVVLESTTDNPAKKVVGTAVIYGVAEMVVNNPDIIKSVGKGVFNAFKLNPTR